MYRQSQSQSLACRHYNVFVHIVISLSAFGSLSFSPLQRWPQQNWRPRLTRFTGEVGDLLDPQVGNLASEDFVYFRAALSRPLTSPGTAIGQYLAHYSVAQRQLYLRSRQSGSSSYRRVSGSNPQLPQAPCQSVWLGCVVLSASVPLLDNHIHSRYQKKITHLKWPDFMGPIVKSKVEACWNIIIHARLTSAMKSWQLNDRLTCNTLLFTDCTLYCYMIEVAAILCVLNSTKVQPMNSR